MVTIFLIEDEPVSVALAAATCSWCVLTSEEVTMAALTARTSIGDRRPGRNRNVPIADTQPAKYVKYRAKDN